MLLIWIGLPELLMIVTRPSASLNVQVPPEPVIDVLPLVGAGAHSFDAPGPGLTMLLTMIVASGIGVPGAFLAWPPVCTVTLIARVICAPFSGSLWITSSG